MVSVPRERLNYHPHERMVPARQSMELRLASLSLSAKGRGRGSVPAKPVNKE